MTPEYLQGQHFLSGVHSSLAMHCIQYHSVDLQVLEQGKPRNNIMTQASKTMNLDTCLLNERLMLILVMYLS